MTLQFAWQVDAIVAELSRQGIPARRTPRPREYAAILTGSTGASSDVFVPAADFERAQEVVRDFYARTNLSEAETPRPTNTFSRILVFSLLSLVMLPLIFNWVATMNYLRFRHEPASPRKRVVALTIVLTGWILAGLIVWQLLKANF